MRKDDYSAAKKLAVVALIASYMCIATACAGSDNMGDDATYYNSNPQSTNDYVNSVTNGTDRNNRNYGTESSINRDSENASRDTGITGNYRDNDSLLENAGSAANDTLDHAGNAANSLLDGAGDVIDDVTDTGTNTTTNTGTNLNTNTTTNTTTTGVR